MSRSKVFCSVHLVSFCITNSPTSFLDEQPHLIGPVGLVRAMALEPGRVLSDGFELVSAGTVMLPFNPHKVGATQKEQQHGLT